LETVPEEQPFQMVPDGTVYKGLLFSGDQNISNPANTHDM
jgi:hypothetical protein